ncbi:hypothetical protein KM176_14465 [Pseudooceanicola sp. CBS1P-1]|uniref:hypothetical protein n=1 Tax=Pseudooceanicola TaxID=1679449 RepID=UPI001925C020|nr:MULTISPECIES: hypothetical protein [Pseudooceanicola]MBT9385070.1 hypothetical protein [Pseudooceanicola endophyticus]
MPRRLAVLSNCLANQNAKVAEFEVCAGAMFPLVEILRAADYRILQMPCPEMTFLGCGRWWQSRPQYDTPGYRRHCRALAETVADLLEGAGAAEAEDVVLFGIDGSPSSGVGVTSFAEGWGGRPMHHPSKHVYGRGVWMEVLLEVFAARGLAEPRLIGVGTELVGYDQPQELERVRAFLNSPRHEAEPTPPPARKEAPKAHSRTPRSRSVLVLPEGGMNDAALCARMEAEGWGLLQLPPDGLETDARDRALSYLVDQVQDYLAHDHRVALAPGADCDLLGAALAARGLGPLPAWPV